MDPWEILGVERNATDGEMRAAYLRKVAQYPPDRSPEEFEKIRDAFEKLKDPRRRMRDMMTATSPFDPLPLLLHGHTGRREFAGPRLWLDALRSESGITKNK
jgi:curved DNA-binding protein CbpA